MTNAELHEFIKERVDSVHKRMDEVAEAVKLDQANLVTHEKACAEQGGIVSTKLGHLDKMSWAILSVLASEGIAGIYFAFYMLTGEWPG